MTKRLYDFDSHQHTFTARVQECIPDGDSYWVVLDQTAFFPEGGGQYADRGTLNGVAVTDAQIDSEGIIRHRCTAALEPGTEVAGELDWALRFRRMQEHSGEHIVSGLVCSTFGCRNIGFHLGDDDVTCDYNVTLTEENIRNIEHRANAVVFQNLPVLAEYPDPAVLATLDYRAKLDLTEDVRIVTIPGVDVCACCAPHVSQTGEIGLIKIVHYEKSHGGTRLHLRCGADALDDYQEKQANVLRIMDLLSAPQAETADATEQLTAANGTLKHALSQAQVQVARAYLDGLRASGGALPQNRVLFLPNAETDTLRALANEGKALCTGVCVALTNSAPLPEGSSSPDPDSPQSYRYMITAADGRPLSRLIRDWNAALNGRGGGKDDMVQGAFTASLQEIRRLFTNLQ